MSSDDTRWKGFILFGCECDFHDKPHIFSQSDIFILKLMPFLSSVIPGMSNRNQRTKSLHHLSSISQQRPVQVPRPSIHPSGPGGTQSDGQTWAAVRLPLPLRGPCRSLECHASSILVVDKVRRAGAVPSVSIMEQRCCSAVVFLWYSRGAAVSYIIRKQRVWLGGGERRRKEVGPSCHWNTH